MPKLLWVALPLLIALALMALQAVLRRRWPARHAANVWSSLLLAAYVLTTAGLGIFWVANQQLPVFDWHYLFGYTTVALVALHLVFNFGIVWRHLSRARNPASNAMPSAAAPGPREAAPASRRRWLGAAGVLLATGVAFVIGLRHGRSELRVLWPGMSAGGVAPASGAAPADATDAGLAFVERFHAFSSHSRAGVLLRAPGVEWGDPPPPFKRYAGAARQALPSPHEAPAAFGLATLATLLWHTAGVSEARTRVKLRTSPSSGALFSTELYVVARQVAGLAPGLWHYDAEHHALERLGSAPTDDAAFGHVEATGPEAPALLVATAVLRRTGHKYRDRSYRYVLADLGHALENLRQAGAAGSGDARFVARFDESRAAATLGLDERDEAVLALAALRLAGPPTRSVPPSAAARAQTPWPDAFSAPGLPNAPAASSRWHVPAPPEAGGLPLGVTAAVHLASSLRSADPPSGAAPSPASPPSLRTEGTLALPHADAGPRSEVLTLIARRRSVRRFAATALPLPALAGVLAGMTAGDGTVPLSSAVRVHLVANAVAGLRPGAYAYDAAAHRLLPRRVGQDLRGAAQAAALDQEVIGAAAAVFVLSIDRAAFAADPAGPARGYRHAFIEAGMVGERIYLEAGARGLATCAVGAFYDDEAVALAGLDAAREWPVHFAALGWPTG